MRSVVMNVRSSTRDRSSHIDYWTLNSCNVNSVFAVNGWFIQSRSPELSNKETHLPLSILFPIAALMTFVIPYCDVEFFEAVGTGAFATVFRGRWKPMNRIVAIKKCTERDLKEVWMYLQQLISLQYSVSMYISNVEKCLSHKISWISVSYLLYVCILRPIPFTGNYMYIFVVQEWTTFSTMVMELWNKYHLGTNKVTCIIINQHQIFHL